MGEPAADRVQRLFDQAVALPPDRRGAFLDAACGGDAALRADVEGLLAYDAAFPDGAGDEGRLNSPLVRGPNPADTDPDTPPTADWSPALPTRIGHYRIVRRIAEGGMGAVYEAEQDSPRRAVALKVIRPGLASPAVLRRFRHEAQILGRLHHPGIAQVYEAGLAEDGQPFFAMEFIRGLPLDEYAGRHGLDLAARIGLLARVCDAVQHAHDQGVIHRDLKPANILVEDTGQPKVLDFGVARVTDADLLTGAGLTQTGQLLGTLNYMSPEVLSADPAAIDHRADVYALGVILFELLARRVPYRLENRPLAEAARLILEQDPPRLGSLAPELRGDLETIVAKALEKDPARRYASAADLAADLRRRLADEPILARPTSALYHLRKFARRNKALVGGVIATAAALVFGLVGTAVFAVAEARQRRQADANARVATAEQREAVFQAYRARLAAAGAALQNHDVADAARHLDAVPEDLRDNWEWRHLHGRLDDSSAVIPMGGAEAGLLPDERRAWALTDAGLRVTDLDGGEGRTLPLRPDCGQAITVTPTRRGLRFVAWTSSTTFGVHDESGRPLFRGETTGISGPNPVAVSPDGARVVFPRLDGDWARLVVVDLDSGKQTAVWEGHHGMGVRSLAFSPDGTRLASGGQSDDRTVRIWETGGGALVATGRGHSSRVLSLTFRRDAARLLTTSSDETARQWDTATGAEVEPPYDRHTGEVTAAVYSPDGQWIATGGIDRTVRVWRATGRQDLAVLHGHTGAVTGLAFLPGGHRLASLSSEAAFWGGDRTVRLWDVDDRATLPVLRGHERAVYPVAFSPDGRWIASGSWDFTVRLWDAATGEPCAVLPHSDVVWALSYTPDGKCLVSATNADSRLRVWDVATARVRKEIAMPAGVLRSVIVSADGARVAATAFVTRENKHQLHVCDVASGERLFSADGWALAYSPDGRCLAVLAADKRTVLLLDARTHETIARFAGHEKPVNRADFSPDGRRLATCSADRTVRVWRIDGGACQVLAGHTDEVFAAAFHPDGRRLATGGRDRAVWLWDLERGEEVARLQGHTSFVWSLAFSPDGATLVSGSGDATVRLWDTSPLKTRYEARRQAEALRPEAERLVESLWLRTDGPDGVVDALRADRSLTEPLRHAAFRAVLRRTLR